MSKYICSFRRRNAGAARDISKIFKQNRKNFVHFRADPKACQRACSSNFKVLCSNLIPPSCFLALFLMRVNTSCNLRFFTSNNRDFEGESLLVVGLLKGAFMAVSDVARNLAVPNHIDFMVASSYGHGVTSSGVIKLKKDLGIDPSGRHVLIVEDLIDTGTTLEWIKRYLQTKKCKSIKICCILDKKARRTADVKVDYIGFLCPDEFVVGYGMDFAEDFRTLPFVGVLKPEAYKTNTTASTAPGSPKRLSQEVPQEDGMTALHLATADES